MTCTKPHTYTVEVVGQPVRYVGTGADAAVSALLSIDIDGGDEGYVVAEHRDGDATIYCPAESNRIENAAMAEMTLARARAVAEAGATTEAAKRIVADPFAAAFDGVQD